MKKGKQMDSKRGERPNMRRPLAGSSERQHQTTASNLKYRQVRSSVGAKSDDDTVYHYYVLWKPYGVAAKDEDTKNAKSLKSFVPIENVYPIGYLDAMSEGLLLLTDNPRFRYGLNHSKCTEQRIFLAQVELPEGEDMVSDEALDKFAEGVVLSDGKTMPIEVEVIEEPDIPERNRPMKEGKNTCWLAMTCAEGWSRHIRRITAALGYPTLRLVQWSLGSVSLYEMIPGQLRELNYREMHWVKSVIDRVPKPMSPAEKRIFQSVRSNGARNKTKNQRPQREIKRWACKDEECKPSDKDRVRNVHRENIQSESKAHSQKRIKGSKFGNANSSGGGRSRSSSSQIRTTSKRNNSNNRQSKEQHLRSNANKNRRAR